MYLNLGNYEIGVKNPEKESRKDRESLKTAG